jgi:hypothetical protein
MPKQFFTLTGDYSGIKARRIRQAGRVVLYKMFGEIFPYWLVQMKNFSEHFDRPRLFGITGSKFGNGSARFLRLKQAKERFEKLIAHPEYAAEAQKAEISAMKKREHLKRLRDSGNALPFPPTRGFSKINLKEPS